MINTSQKAFKSAFNMVQSYLQTNQKKSALCLLKNLYNEYLPILGETDKNIIACSYLLAYLYVDFKDYSNANLLFEHIVKQIYSHPSEFEDTLSYNIQMSYAQSLLGVKDINAAITILEQLKDSLKVDLIQNKKKYSYVLDSLSSLYNSINNHEKTIENDCELLDILTKEHAQKYGNLISKDNLDYNETTLNKIISLYLGIGASFSRLKKYHEAKQYLEKGYFISYFSYGDKDERTLKLNYNLAANEFSGINPREGIRQLNFVYNDMLNYLGTNNKYTVKARNLLISLGEITET